MATIEEIERLDREVKIAEHNALANLAAHFRAAILDLPVESRLAREFARQAKEFDYRARAAHLDPAAGVRVELNQTLRALRDATRENVLGAVAEAMREASRNLDPADPLRHSLDDGASKLGGL